MIRLVQTMTDAERIQIHRRIQALTQREREVMAQLVIGDTTADIAELLHITGRTVGVYRNNIVSKMNARNTADAVRMVVAVEYSQSHDDDDDDARDDAVVPMRQ